MTFADKYLDEHVELIRHLDPYDIEDCVEEIANVRDNEGRLFVIGVGGSAATASHVVNDLRKLAFVEAYAPTDNVAEVTARTNDDGWDSTFVAWLDCCRINEDDGVLVLSVGGGSDEASPNIVAALHLAVEVDASIIGVVGRDGGYTARVAHACVRVPPIFEDRVTPHTEGIASVLTHLFVSHPSLAR